MSFAAREPFRAVSLQPIHSGVRFLVTTASLALVAACSPASVAEAEAQKDVAWLDAHPSRPGMEALGRLADHDTHAVTALAKRRGDADVYHAAWQAHTRGSPWGDDVLHVALSSPAELPLAVSELPARDPRLEGFVADLAKGIESAPPEHAVSAVALLASIGPEAQPALVRLLDRPALRDATCKGLATPDVASESRFALTLSGKESRSSAVCRATLFQHAVADDKVLDWVAASAETDVIAAASRDLECTDNAHLWEKILASSRDSLVELEPSLTVSAAHCASALDPVIARALPAVRRIRVSVLRALVQGGEHVEQMDATCKQLPRLSHGRSVADDVRALATSVYVARCKTS